VLLGAADLPDPRVLLLPHLAGVVGEGGHEPPLLLLEHVPQPVELVGRLDELAVDVELDLLGRAVPDADGL
jgi:hypothetical protein